MQLNARLFFGALLTVSLSLSVATVTTSAKDKGSRGGTKSIICTVKNEAFKEWKLPNGQVVTSTNPDDRPHVERMSNGRYSLVIKDIKISDGGNYVCQGSKTSSSFLLQIQFAIDKSSLKEQKIYLNKVGTLKLGASGFPQPEFIWKKDGTTIKPTGRFQVLDDGSLQITKVEVNDGGKYEYFVSQFDGSDRDSGEITVSIFEPAKITHRPKAKQYPSQGYNITMKCVASGYPSPTYTWKNPGGGVINSHGRFHVNEGILTIRNVVPTDIGTYTCEASSGDGTVASAKARIVNVYVAPKIVLNPKESDILTDLGKSLNLECTARVGTPPVQVVWKRGNKKDERQKQSPGKSVISLKAVRSPDEGDYTCEATNIARDADGNVIVVNKSVRLSVKSAPVVNKKASPSAVYSFVGNKMPVYIRCSFYGYPIPEVKMYDDKNKKVANGTREAVYKLTTKKAEVFKTYRCLAKNDYGSTNHTMQLKFAEPPTEIRNLRDSARSCNTISLKWEEPVKDGGMPVVQYVIQYEEITKNVEASKTEFEAPQLQRKKGYTFKVWPRNSAHRGPEKKITVTTKAFCRPSRPVIVEPLSEILDDTKFTLKWRKPEENGGDSKIRYKVRYTTIVADGKNAEKKELETSKLEIELSGLKLGTQYTVEVVAINKGGESDPATRLYQVPNVGARSRSHATSASLLFMVLTVGVSLAMK